MAFYSNPNYWDQRYLATAEDKPCEWYRGYSSLRRLLDPSTFSIKGTGLNKVEQQQASNVAEESSTSSLCRFPPRERTRILILGCGNSTLGEDMLHDGWEGGIINIDFSSVVIAQMKAKYAHHAISNDHFPSGPKMQFLCADMTKRLPFENASFDLIVCKGSFDAVLSGCKASVPQVVAEAHRVLAHGHGVFVLVTNGNPDSRLEYLEYKFELDHYWQSVSVHPVPAVGVPKTKNDKTVYAYVCRKGGMKNATSAVDGKENVGTTPTRQKI